MTNFLKYCFSTILLFSQALNAQVLSNDEFEAKLKTETNVQLIDVRTPDEYKGGHLPKAQNINYRAVDFEQQIAKLDKNKPVYVYCLAGGRSKAASDVLQRLGYTQVYDLKGGYLKWSEAQKPTEGGRMSESQAMKLSDLENIINKNEVVLLDFFAEWCGPCQVMSPWIEKLKKEYTGQVYIQKVDSDANRHLASHYGIDALPTLILIKNGKILKKEEGLMYEKDIRRMIEKAL
jgi:thioredoxin 1